MKILMVSHYVLPHRGGIETIVDKLSRAFSEQGHEIKILSSANPQSIDVNSQSIDLIAIKSIDPLKKHGIHYPLFSLSLFWATYKAVKWADIVHVHGMLYQNSFFALVMAFVLRRPSILTEHAGFVKYERWMFNIIQQIANQVLGRLALFLSSAIIIPDKVVGDILIKEFGIAQKKITQIPLGVDTEIFRPVPASEKLRLRDAMGWNDRPKILFIGNFVARKRIELLLKAQSDTFDIVLCGEGYPSDIKSSVVLVYPPTSHDKIAVLYQASDVFVVPSSVETFSIVSYEAMACGLPLILTEDLHHLSIVNSNLTITVKARADELRNAIHALISDSQRCEMLGKTSAEWVGSFYSWSRSIHMHVALYRSLVSSP